MKTRLLIIIVIIIFVAIYLPIHYYYPFLGIGSTTEVFVFCEEGYAKVNDECVPLRPSPLFPESIPESEILSWCADRFDQTKHEFHQSLEEYTCDTTICPESEPPIFSSALNSDEGFIEKGCAKFVDKWAYMTEDNNSTWHSVNWESFVKHHYESDPILDPQRNEKCADLFDLIMRSGEDSDLWYELTETNDFRDAKCASIVSEWEHLTEHDVWNIGISWDNVVEHELYGCGENEIYHRGICMTLETKEKSESIGEKENEK